MIEKKAPGKQMKLQDFLAEWNSKEETVCVKTSGSTGAPKQMLVEKRRMLASARMTCDFLGLEPGDSALLCMSLDYIAGKMMVVRSLERGLKLIEREPTGHPLSEPLPQIHGKLFAAMVPLQVWNTLQISEERERLMQIDHLIIGGGAISEQLERELRNLPNAIWSSYGMTETLSHIALRRLNGPSACKYYQLMKGIQISKDENECLVIKAPALNKEILFTHDIVELHSEDTFSVKGRLDNVICSGGIKIQIEEVEECLHSAGYREVIVTSVPDEKFGESVVLLCTEKVNRQALREHLPNPYWAPKYIIQTEEFPLTETGKPDRAKARLIAAREVGRV